MKRFLVLSLALILVILAGCSKAPSAPSPTGDNKGPAATTKPKKEYVIGVAIANMPDPFFVSVYYGMVEQAKEMGAKLIMADAGGYANVAKQVSQMDDFIVKKVDGIALVAVDPAGTASVVQKAADAKIPVINLISKTNGPVISYVGSSQQELGEHQAEYMVKALNGKGNVVMVPGPAGASWAVERAQAFEAYMAKNAPEIKILSKKWTPSTREAGMNQMQDFIQTFPKIDGVYTGSDTVGFGVARAILAANMGGKIVMTTAVMERDTEKLIREGTIMMSAAQQAVLIGREAIKSLVKHLNGEKISNNIVIHDKVVTKETVGTLDLSTIRSPEGFRP